MYWSLWAVSFGGGLDVDFKGVFDLFTQEAHI